MRKNLLLMVLLLFAANMMAQQLTEQEAKQRAMDFLNKSNRAKGFNQGARQLRSVKSSMSRLYAFTRDGYDYEEQALTVRINH